MAVIKASAAIAAWLLFFASTVWAWEGAVIRVQDGDTIAVLHPEGQAVVVRLWGIDAPEGGQEWGDEATRYARDLAEGQDVRVEKMDVDRYGRTVALVHLPDGQNLNAAMIRAGLAWVFPRYCNRPEICIPWALTQQEAQASQHGLWSETAPVPPWEWRRR